MGLSTTIDAAVLFTLTGNPALGSATGRFDGFPNITLDDGTGANQANRVYTGTLTIAASGNQDLDLNGTLVDPVGGPAVFAKVKAIAVKARATNTNNVVVSPAPTNGFVGPFGAATHTIAIQPGGEFLIVAPGAGWTVTAATADLLRLANSGAGSAVIADVVIIGTSA